MYLYKNSSFTTYALLFTHSLRMRRPGRTRRLFVNCKTLFRRRKSNFSSLKFQDLSNQSLRIGGRRLKNPPSGHQKRHFDRYRTNSAFLFVSLSTLPLNVASPPRLEVIRTDLSRRRSCDPKDDVFHLRQR